MFQCYLLYIDLNILLQVVPIEVQDEVVHQVKAVTDNDEGQLIGELGFLQEVLHPLGIIAAALPTDPLYFLHLTCLAGSLWGGGRRGPS